MPVEQYQLYILECQYAITIIYFLLYISIFFSKAILNSQHEIDQWLDFGRYDTEKVCHSFTIEVETRIF